MNRNFVVCGPVRSGRFSGLGARSYLAANLDVGDRRFTLGWSTSAGAVTDRLDPVVAAALLPAMRAGLAIRVNGPVSPALRMNHRKIQQLFARWDPTFSMIELDSPAAAVAQRASRTAAFFSGGVDSFHTAIEHLNEIDSLIFIHGFDIGPERRSLLERIAQAVRAAASELGKPLVEVRTDLKHMSQQYVSWSWFHGSALASAAHLLAQSFGRVYIPGSLSYDYPHPYGSHPLVDPFWSTDQVELVYDGFDANRIEKMAVVADNPVAMRWLRVCNDRDDDGYNCGRCEKCLRTMVSLELLGRLGRAHTLPRQVVPSALEQLRPVWNRDLWEQNLELAELTHARPALVAGIRDVLNRHTPAPTRRVVRWTPASSRQA